MVGHRLKCWTHVPTRKVRYCDIVLIGPTKSTTKTYIQYHTCISRNRLEISASLWLREEWIATIKAHLAWERMGCCYKSSYSNIWPNRHNHMGWVAAIKALIAIYGPIGTITWACPRPQSHNISTISLAQFRLLNPLRAMSFIVHSSQPPLETIELFSQSHNTHPHHCIFLRLDSCRH